MDGAVRLETRRFFAIGGALNESIISLMKTTRTSALREKRLLCLLTTLLLPLAAGGRSPADEEALAQRIRAGISLTEARRGFATHLLTRTKTPDPVPQPPRGFELVHYDAPLGSFPAYVATASGKGRHPAIVWLTGGFDNSIGDTPWAPATPDNDQSARAFPAAGVVTMYPSLRGGNNNPGYRECEYGEVDDALAAARYLATRPDVDPTRVYVGGHSTGGTLALLVAESVAPGIRAVFAFGPVTSAGSYGEGNLPFDTRDKRELFLRAPILYLKAIKCPTFAFEGTSEPSNIGPLHKLAANSSNPLLHFYELPGRTHFSALAPITPLVARALVSDTGTTAHIDFTANAAQIVPIYR